MPTQLLTIAKNTFVEATRQPFYLFLIVASGILQVFNTWGTGFAMSTRASGEVAGDNKLLLDIGLATVFVCGMLLAGFIATAVVSREIENKTALTVVSKPVSRTTIIVGKYLGVVAAIILAVTLMLIFLLLAIRHGVLSTAADRPDGPVIVFSSIAAFTALAIAAWTNYFYGWSFTQTASILLLPAFLLAYFAVLLIDKEWHFQNIVEPGYFYDDRMHTLTQYQRDVELGRIQPNWEIIEVTRFPTFRPQIAVACAALAMAILVLSAVATAVSTRLGHVMTIVVCAGVFVLGLLSDHLLGRRAFDNQLMGFIDEVSSTNPADTSFSREGSEYEITLDSSPIAPIEVGDSFYYGSSPNGSMLAVPMFPPAPDNLESLDQLARPGEPGRLIVVSSDDTELVVRQAGPVPVPVLRPPRKGDAVFTRPTTVHPLTRIAWGVIPNMQFFWLVDAVSQNHPVPARHMALLGGYSALQIIAFLALGVALFQTRDVG